MNTLKRCNECPITEDSGNGIYASLLFLGLGFMGLCVLLVCLTN